MKHLHHSHVHLRSIFDTIPRLILQCLCHAKNNKLLNSTYNALIFINIACMQTVISYGQTILSQTWMNWQNCSMCLTLSKSVGWGFWTKSSISFDWSILTIPWFLLSLSAMIGAMIFFLILRHRGMHDNTYTHPQYIVTQH